MANSYVTINSKKYAVRMTRYEPTTEKVQVVRTTVGGKHFAQDFSVTEYRWGYNLRVDYTPASGYGSLSDIRAAYALSSVSFTDHYGNSHTVYSEGILPEIPDSPSIDGSGSFTVPVNLRKKLT